MGFKLLLLSDPSIPESLTAAAEWPERLKTELPDLDLYVAASPAEAEVVIGEVAAAFGYLPPDLFEKAGKLRWLASPRAGPNPSFYHPALIESEVQVTNVRGIYNDHISAQVMAYFLAFAGACRATGRNSAKGGGEAAFRPCICRRQPCSSSVSAVSARRRPG